MNAIHYLDGQWVEGNPPILGPMTHASWMASVVFDGGRSFSGLTPDLDLHCARIVNSAHAFGMNPMLTGGEIPATDLLTCSVASKTSNISLMSVFGRKTCTRSHESINPLKKIFKTLSGSSGYEWRSGSSSQRSRKASRKLSSATAR